MRNLSPSAKIGKKAQPNAASYESPATYWVVAALIPQTLPREGTPWQRWEETTNPLRVGRLLNH